MGWTETCAMDERIRFVREAMRPGGEDSMSALCDRYGISRKTGYKWLERFEQDGRAGLKDRSRAPRAHPNAVEAGTVERIIALRRAHRSWGAKKLLPVLQARWPKEPWPAHSTVGEILKRNGLVESERPMPRSKRTVDDRFQRDNPDAGPSLVHAFDAERCIQPLPVSVSNPAAQ